MKLPVEARELTGTWVRHAPSGSALLGRSAMPSDGRWQRGGKISALYLADSTSTADAEWYRSLAEWGLHPEDFLPFDHHFWEISLELADLSDSEKLAEVSLSMPVPSRRDWPAFQKVGESLWKEGWAGLLAPSAARPASSVVCVFADAWPPEDCQPVKATRVSKIPAPPRGMST